MKVVVECGQRWWRLSSWYRRYPGKIYYPQFRRFEGGFAFGPIMFVRRG